MLRSSLVIIAACTGMLSFSAEARPISTDECLDKGLCAYVSPTGRVTCGKCPGQVRAIDVAAGATAICNDETSEKRKDRRGACKGHGGVAAFLTPANSAARAEQAKP